MRCTIHFFLFEFLVFLFHFSLCAFSLRKSSQSYLSLSAIRPIHRRCSRFRNDRKCPIRPPRSLCSARSACQPERMSGQSKKHICYYYDGDIGECVHLSRSGIGPSESLVDGLSLTSFSLSSRSPKRKLLLWTGYVAGNLCSILVRSKIKNLTAIFSLIVPSNRTTGHPMKVCLPAFRCISMLL